MLLVVCCDGDGPGDGGWLGPGDVHRAKRAK